MKIKLIELIKNIKKNIVGFISLTVFLFLAITLFQGLDFTGNSILHSIDGIFCDSNLYDVNVATSSLVTQNDVESFNNIDGVDEVEGYFTVSDDFTFGEKKFTASITSITSDVSKCVVTNGKVPVEANEIAIFERCADALGISIGDQISFTRKNEIGFLRALAFSESISSTDLNDTLNFKTESFVVTAFVTTGNPLNHSPNVHPLDTSNGIPVNAVFYAPYASFNQTITASGFNGLYLRSNELKQYKYFDEKYINESEKLAAKVKAYAESNLKTTIDYVTAFNSDLAVRQFAKDFLYSHGYITPEQYASDPLFDIAVNVIGNQLNALEKNVSFGKKNSILGTSVVTVLSNLFLDDRYAMGGVFFAISILICFSVITRLVVDESVLIGTKKALGFTRREMLFNYLVFSLAGVLLAVIFGNGMSVILETILVPSVLHKSFTLPRVVTYFDWRLMLIIAAISVVSIGLITFFACRGVIKKNAISLLHGESKTRKRSSKQRERSAAKSKNSLFMKTVLDGFFADGKKTFAMILGISSSLALLIASFSLKFTVADSFNKQYAEYFHFDTISYVNSNVPQAKENIENFFKEENDEYSPIYFDSCNITIKGHESFIGNIIVYFDNASFDALIHMDPSANNPSFDHKGIWLPESYQQDFKCPNESEVEVVETSGLSATSTTTGFYRFYNYDCILFIDAETYKEAFGEEARPNSYLVNRSKCDFDTFYEKANQVEGHMYSLDYYGRSQSDVGIFNMVLTICYSLYLAATAVLSLFVILNLLLTNVEEKKRDIITVMINGYSRSEAAKYVYYDSILQTFISLFIGTGFGLLLGWYGQVSLESKILYFIHTPNILSVVVSIPITIALVALMTLIALRRLKKFKLSDLTNA
ncbi:MAG: ABC transporter permease [Bacilli bacterium]|nr:ABC transporter permease [Bacilli bacterium]